ncbi:hypothetical protein FQN60_006248, partial [Etheostoma spectabile]
MQTVWETKRKHTACFQDVPGLDFYMKKGQITKGGVVLHIYRRACGTASIESFHLHLNRFIPGTSACGAYFNLYLLEGRSRWNEDRGREAVTTLHLRCYSQQQQQVLNRLTQEFYGLMLVETYMEARESTGELTGMDYLLAQSDHRADQDLWG